MAFHPVHYIRRRSREEWQQLAAEQWTEVRIWVQENGEKAALLALVIGIALVLFYKLVLIVLALSVAVGCAAWNIALPAIDQGASNPPGPQNPAPAHTEEPQ